MDRPVKRIKTDDGHSNGAEKHSGTNGAVQVEDNHLADKADITQDLYLETVDRHQLDFDQERICSVTLSKLNVYACLVCGKYFSGRSKTTPAFFHALNDDHHVFINLTTVRVYILPDGYENVNPALNDVKYAIRPVYETSELAQLGLSKEVKRDVTRATYRPGFVGLSQLTADPHLLVLFHAFAHVTALRNQLLTSDFQSRSDLMQSYALLVRKIWSGRLIRAHLSPAEPARHFLAAQKTRRGLNKVLDATTFFINYISKFTNNVFQGELEVQSQAIIKTESLHSRTRFEASHDISTTKTKFQVLSLSLPPAPLFQSAQVPQVSLMELLAQYNGDQVTDSATSRKRYKLLTVNKYIIFQIPRFERGNVAGGTKNPTVVNFPLTGLDMTPYLPPSDTEKSVFDLCVNMTQESRSRETGPDEEIYRVQVRDKGLDKWMQMEALQVQEVKRDMMNVGAPSVMQIWERRM